MDAAGTRFRSAPPLGRRPSGKEVDGLRPMFRSAPPRGGRPRGEAAIRTDTRFRSAPPRGGRRPVSTIFLRPSIEVSIRAPAREATTRASRASTCARSVSIRAPARGRRPQTVLPLRSIQFRSAPPRGGDKQHGDAFRGTIVSIRAPARGRRARRRNSPGPSRFDPRPREGATDRRDVAANNRIGFDPRPREGATTFSGGQPLSFSFRSAPPRGGDRAADSDARDGRRFDPRPREGATSRCVR